MIILTDTYFSDYKQYFEELANIHLNGSCNSFLLENMSSTEHGKNSLNLIFQTSNEDKFPLIY